MSEYKTYIEKLAYNKESMVFFNSGPLHAAVVMSTIFKYSKDTLNIFAGNLNSGISKDKEYLSNLKNFLDKDGKLNLILDSFDISSMNDEIKLLLRTYQFFKPTNLNIRSTQFSIIDSDNNDSKIHFTIGDNLMYRLEEDTNNYKARGSFNDPKYCDHLNELFTTLMDSKNSTPVTIN